MTEEQSREKIAQCFPLIHQALLDAYKVEAHLLLPPYYGEDIAEAFDLGIRKLVWGDNYSTNVSGVFNLSDEKKNQNTITCIKSQLGFYNIGISTEGIDSPMVMALTPFLTEPMSPSRLNRIIQENHIGAEYTSTLFHIYENLPVLNLNDLLNFLSHMLTFFIPEFANHSLHEINYHEEHILTPMEERVQRYTSDQAQAINVERKKMFAAILSGDRTAAVSAMQQFMDATALYHGQSIQEFKEALITLNTMIATHTYDTIVHPIYIYRLSNEFQQRIRATSSISALTELPLEMARRYSLLVHNYTYDHYSYLVRNIINYITEHCTEALTLTEIAEVHKKSPNYISATFKKEVGESLISYLNRAKMQQALMYFNTTSMSVAEISSAVGIEDFSYFSHMFKRYIGVSPREYKKMLDK